MAPTAPVKIEARPFIAHDDSLEFNLLSISDLDGNVPALIEFHGKAWKLTRTDSNWMAAYYAPAEATE
jgi:hypothetical protein